MTVPAPPAGRLAVRADRALTAAGLTGPFRRDAALAVLLAAVTVLLLAVASADPVVTDLVGPVPATVQALVAGQTLLLCLRRVAPGSCLMLVAVAQAALSLLAPLEVTVRGPATAVAAYTCGTALPARRTGWLVALAALAETGGIVLAAARAGGGTGSTPAEVVSGVAVLAVGALAGSWVATRRRYLELVELRAGEAVAVQRARADAAVRRERTRMARELHDIAAHHLSAMVVQAGVVEQLVERDPPTARRTAGELRQQGRRTLRDLRTVVGTLREPGVVEDPGTDAPVPGLAGLDRLVDQVRALGTPVVLECRGEQPAPAPIADVTCHRVVQEALANAREHAPGAAVRVAVTTAPGRVLVEVENDPPLSPAAAREPRDGTRGYGLVGMRERAQLVGATFEAGPTTEGGWRVRLAVPVEQDEPDTTTEDTA